MFESLSGRVAGARFSTRCVIQANPLTAVERSNMMYERAKVCSSTTVESGFPVILWEP